jgi:hypothetical protein
MLHVLKRHELVTKAEFCIQHAHLIDYEETRPMPKYDWYEFVSLMKRGERVSFDCSTYVTLLYRWCELPDPNGLGYSGDGYTGTLYDHLSDHYEDPHATRAGSLSIWGHGEGEDLVTTHVAMVIDGDQADPILTSHGMAFTCGPIRLSAENEFHPGEWQRFCNVSGE